MTLRKVYKQIPWLLILPLIVGALGIEAETYVWVRLANGTVGAIGGVLAFLAVITARPVWHCIGWAALCVLGLYAMVDPAQSESFWEIVLAMLDE